MDSGPTEDFKSLIFVITGVILLVFAVLISIPNGLLLYVLYKDPLKTFRKPTAVLVVSLAVTDFLTGCVTAVDVGLAHMLEGLHKPMNMLQAKIVSQVTVRSSVFIMTMFALERFLAVVYPFFYRNSVTVGRVIVCCVFCLVVAIVTSLLEMVIDRKVYDVVFLYVIFVVPLITVCFSYIAAYCAVKRRPMRLKRRNNNGKPRKPFSTVLRRQNKNSSELSAKIEKQLMKTASLIVFVFVLSLLPFWSFTILARYCKQCAQEKWFLACYRFSIPVLYSNSGLNPLLYAWRMRQYRASFQTLFMKRKEKANTTLNSPSNCNSMVGNEIFVNETVL